MTKENLEQANELIHGIAAMTAEDAENLLCEFLDRVEEDEHIVYELKRIREYREELCKLQAIINR